MNLFSHDQDSLRESLMEGSPLQGEPIMSQEREGTSLILLEPSSSFRIALDPRASSLLLR